MASTEAPPIERLEVDPGTLGRMVTAIGAATDRPCGVLPDVRDELDKPLDPTRVKKKPGKGYDYLAEHDVVRTANRIFGYGRWGTEVVELVSLGQHQINNAKDEQGWYVGYRCTVRLTVAGCVPVDGVGYGDAFEKQWSGIVTAHELAVKEAESDAIKRAFKKYGDQFGLILYAKDEDKARIVAEANAADAEQKREAHIAEVRATDEQIEEVKALASRVGPDARKKADDAIKQHRDKNETERGVGPIVDKNWLAKLSDALMKQGEADDGSQVANTRLKTPEGIPNTVTDGTPASDEDVAAAFGS